MNIHAKDADEQLLIGRFAGVLGHIYLDRRIEILAELLLDLKDPDLTPIEEARLKVIYDVRADTLSWVLRQLWDLQDSVHAAPRKPRPE